MEAVRKSKGKQTRASRNTYGNVNNLMVGTNHLHLHFGNSGEEVKDFSPEDKKIPQNNVLPHPGLSAHRVEETKLKQKAESGEEIKTKQMALTGDGKCLADSQQLVQQDVEGYQINNANPSLKRRPLSCETDTSNNEKERIRDIFSHRGPEVEIQDHEAETISPNSLDLELDLGTDSILGPVWNVTNPKTTENRKQTANSDPVDFESCEIVESCEMADSQQLVSQDVEGCQTNAISSQVPVQRRPLSCETNMPSNEKEGTRDVFLLRDPEVEIQDSEVETLLPNSLDLGIDLIVGNEGTNPKDTENRRQMAKSGPPDFESCEIAEESFKDGVQTHKDNTAADFRQHGLICDTTVPHSLSRHSSLVTVQCQRNILNFENQTVIPSDDCGLDFERSEPKELCSNRPKSENASITCPQVSEAVTVPMTSSKGQEPFFISGSNSIDEGFKSSSLFDEDEYCIIEAEDVDLEYEEESGNYEISEQPGSDIHMHGDNILNVNIGDCIVRSHSLEENTHVKMRYRKIKQRQQHVDGMRQNDRLEIVIHIDPCPEAEQAAVDQLNQDDTLCSRITTAFYNLGCSIMRFRFGSVVIELRPDSKDSVEQINRAIDDGTFDSIILDILKQEPVFQLIKGKDVTIDVDFNVPEDFVSEEGCSGELKTRVNDESGKRMFGVCVHIGDGEEVPDKSLSPSTGQRQQESDETTKEIRRLLRDVANQIERESKMKKELVVQLRKLAEELDVKLSNMSKAKIALASSGIVGSVLAITGIALAPVTFGASLGLMIAGVGIGVGSGVGGISTTIADKIINKRTMTETQTILSKYQTVVSNLLNLLQELKALKGADLQRHIAEELTGVDAATLLNLKTIFSETTSGTGDEDQSDLSATDRVTSAVENSSFTMELATNAGSVAGKAMVTTIETGLRAVRIGGIVVAALTVPLDVYTLVTNSIKLHKKTPCKISEEIRKLADRIESYNPLDPCSESKMTTEGSTEITRESTSKAKTPRLLSTKSDKAYIGPLDTGK